jgi:hypothetical protein
MIARLLDKTLSAQPSTFHQIFQRAVIPQGMDYRCLLCLEIVCDYVMETNPAPVVHIFAGKLGLHRRRIESIEPAMTSDCHIIRP